MSNASLYEVTSTVIRHGYTRAYVNVHHVAAEQWGIHGSKLRQCAAALRIQLEAMQ